MGRLRTLRGTSGNAGAGPKLVFRYDGVDLSRGWKILTAVCTDVTDPSATSRGFILHTDDSATTPAVMMSNNQVIGWAGGPPTSSGHQIDPNHVIVKDLYLSAVDAATNYLIILEEMPISDTENIIYQLKERAQGSIE